MVFKMTFNNDFEEFIQLWKNSNYIFLARPIQKLTEHVANILTKMEEYFILNPPFHNDFKNLIYLGGYFSTLAHDFGKLLPHFQYKLYKEQKGKKIAPIPNEELKYSYHSLIGALFGYCLCKEYEEKISRKNSKNSFENQDIVIEKNLVKYLEYFCFEAIFSHHAPYIVNNFDELLKIYDNTDFDKIFSYLNIIYPNIMNFFAELLIAIKKKRLNIKIELGKNPNIPIFNTSDLLELFKKGLKRFNKKFINKISNNSNYENPFKLTISDEIDLIKEDFYQIQQSKDDLITPIEKYVIQTYISSLLCDLDIWDARFHINNKNKRDTDIGHSLRFYQINDLCKDYKIIENYVSKPFGKIDNNFKSFQPEEPTCIIDLLRNNLFFQASKENIKIGAIYSLNSPTGSGKTLTLLNKALQALKKYQTELNFQTKIIYCLPFVSIGTQVASQIQDIFMQEKNFENLLNSPLLTIDNYTSESIWNLYDEYINKNSNILFNEEEQIIYGKDAKWLISTWRSQFIVTTFVKFFHSLLKPTKKNYLRFHRIANSIIILDEIQCLPIGYWDIIKEILLSLSKILNCTIFLSTATQPALMSESQKIEIAKSHLKDKIKLNGKFHNKTIHESLNRYTIKFFSNTISLDDFIQKFKRFLINSDEDILFVVNTKTAAIKIYLEIKKENFPNTELLILSTLVLPVDRKKNIEDIKIRLEKRRKGKEQITRQIVISTQVVEAGVDFSFPVVFRDFAPLDSIIQIAGRCNRGLEYEEGIFYLFKLKENKSDNSLFFHKIYKSSGVQKITSKYLEELSNNKRKDKYFGYYSEIDEPKLRLKFQDYFQKIRNANLTEMLLNDLKIQNYSKLSNKFDLIAGYPNQVLVFLPINNNAKILHDKYQDKKLKHLIGEFYLYTITLDKKVVKRLISSKIIKETRSKEHDLIYYYIEPEELKNWYSRDTGFIYIIDDGSLRGIFN